MNGEEYPIQKTSSAWGSGSKGRPSPNITRASSARNERLEALHDRFIALKWTPKAGERNRFIVEAIPFLHHAMCDDAVEALAMRYYDDNSTLWRDTRGTHESEMRAHLRNVERRFVEEVLPLAERRVYAELTTERLRAAFRICRYLAYYESIREECEGEQFLMAYGDMGNRLLMDGTDASNLMKRLTAIGVVEMVKNGVQRQPGVRGRATVWRWSL
jgi:hypothetical protein